MDERKTLRIIAYFAEILICCAIEGIPGLLPEINGALPTLTIALCITVALFETENTSIAIGAACGILIDISSSTIVGPMGIVMAVLCFIISYLASEVFQKSIPYALCACALGCFLGISAVFLFYHTSNGIQYYFEFCSLRTVYTFGFSIILYLVNGRISGNSYNM